MQVFSFLRQIQRRGARCALAAFALMWLAATPTAADSGQRLTVVELYTSQGCSSCPPADAYLGELAGRTDILALGFHVDYWDYIGWSDPFAHPRYTKRQEAYIRLGRQPYVFTPHMVVDGVRQASGRQRAEIARHIAAARESRPIEVAVSMTRTADDQIRVRVAAAGYGGAADVMLVRLDARHETQVRAGENGGQRLVNFNVVRMLRPLATWRGQQIDVTVRLMDLHDANQDYCAVFVQERGQGRIIGAALLDLRDGAHRLR